MLNKKKRVCIINWALLCLALSILMSATSVYAKNESCNINVINKISYRKFLDYLLISNRDVNNYKKIFNSLDGKDYKNADRLIAKLENNIVLGDVLAEKYLKHGYKASYKELKTWLEEYSDLPQAMQIYRLAVIRGGSSGLNRPQRMQASSHIYGWKNVDIEHLNTQDRQYLSKQVATFRQAIKKGKTKAARDVLEQVRFRKLAPNKYWDDMAATLSLKYFVDGYNDLALTWSTKAAKRGTSGTAFWVAGLSNWKLHRYKDAANYFSKLATSKNDDEWLVAAGAYWSYRAYDKLDNKKQAQKWLKFAAKYKHTFYGIMAGQKLGLPMNYNWDAIVYLNNFENYDYVYELLESPFMRRAIILISIGQFNVAEQELRFGYNEMTPKQKEATIYIANQYKMHSLAIYACNNLKDVEAGTSYDGVSYPIPNFMPQSNWKVDKALVLALVRQESAFKPEAISPAGATGLMQLMPNTAFHITKDKSLKKDKTRLMKTDYNLELGQQYVSYLMAKPYIEGNLFYMMTAYNAGPGNLLKWEKKMNYDNDPLMFIEIIPASETRIYIERVMANYWIYNARFGLGNPTLEQVANGKWPSL